MTMYADNDNLALIKRSILLSAYIAKSSKKVKKAGNSDVKFMALCPLHENTKTPAMSITDRPEGGYWKCFAGCGGGSIIDFWLQSNGLDPKDYSQVPVAIEALAREMKITLFERPENSKSYNSSSRERKALQRVSNVLHEHLMNDKSAEKTRKYLKSRDLTKRDLEEYQYGALPDSSRKAVKLMLKAVKDEDLLIETGMVRKSEEGDLWTPFYGRLMIPIKNDRGDTIAFGARVVPEVNCYKAEDAKWINSPETKLYSKSKALYGMDKRFAKKDVIVGEGYFDVLAIDVAGYTGAATCGTSLTPQHVQLLETAKSVTLLFDGDEAGLKALVASYWAVNHRADIKYGLLKDGKDPFDMVIRDDEDLNFESGRLLSGVAKAKWGLEPSPQEFDKWVATCISNLESSDHKDQLITQAAKLRGVTKSAYSRNLSLESVVRRARSGESEQASVEVDRNLESLVRFIISQDDDEQQAIASLFEDPNDLKLSCDLFLPGGETAQGKRVYKRLFGTGTLGVDAQREADTILASASVLENTSIRRVVSSILASIRTMSLEISSAGAMTPELQTQLVSLRVAQKSPSLDGLFMILETGKICASVIGSLEQDQLD